jgi:DNA polymerase III subunit beta
MRVIIERAHLLKSLSHVQRVVERRNTIPILSNILLSAQDACVVIKATDLDLEINETTIALVEEQGATTVPAHLLYEIVRKLPDGGEIMLKTNPEATLMTVTSGRSSFRLPCLSQADFPELSVGTFSHSFRMNALLLKQLIDKTHFAVSNEETRYYLNGIYFHTIDVDGVLKLRAVATDGHRLARAEVDAPEGSKDMPGIIVPRKTVAELQKLGDDPDIIMDIEVSDSKIRLTVASVVLTSKLIDGTFPDYQRVIPKGNDKKLTIDRAALTQAVDRVSTISSERGRAVKLTIAQDMVTLTVNSPDSSSAQEEVACVYEADHIDIGFNAKYLLDITSQLSGNVAIFMLNDSGSPTLISDSVDEDALYVLMPMRV